MGMARAILAALPAFWQRSHSLCRIATTLHKPIRPKVQAASVVRDKWLGSMALEGPPPSVLVLGLPVHRVDLNGTLAAISRWIDRQRQTCQGTVLHQIVTLNPEMAMTAQSDPRFAAIIGNADLSIADGMGIVWAARLRQRKLARVTGVDVLEGTASLAAKNGYRLFLLGARPGVAAAAAEALARRYPLLPPVGTLSGSPENGARAALVMELTRTRPDILFVAFGSPAQERWIAGLRSELGGAGVSVAVGVGGAFDYVSGRIIRAPYWMRRLGLEWLYRLLREPWRWRRMLALPRFALAVWRTSM